MLANTSGSKNTTASILPNSSNTSPRKSQESIKELKSLRKTKGGKIKAENPALLSLLKEDSKIEAVTSSKTEMAQPVRKVYVDSPVFSRDDEHAYQFVNPNVEDDLQDSRYENRNDKMRFASSGNEDMASETQYVLRTSGRRRQENVSSDFNQNRHHQQNSTRDSLENEEDDLLKEEAYQRQLQNRIKQAAEHDTLKLKYDIPKLPLPEDSLEFDEPVSSRSNNVADSLDEDGNYSSQLNVDESFGRDSLEWKNPPPNPFNVTNQDQSPRLKRHGPQNEPDWSDDHPSRIQEPEEPQDNNRTQEVVDQQPPLENERYQDMNNYDRQRNNGNQNYPPLNHRSESYDLQVEYERGQKQEEQNIQVDKNPQQQTPNEQYGYDQEDVSQSYRNQPHHNRSYNEQMIPRQNYQPQQQFSNDYYQNQVAINHQQPPPEQYMNQYEQQSGMNEMRHSNQQYYGASNGNFPQQLPHTNFQQQSYNHQPEQQHFQQQQLQQYNNQSTQNNLKQASPRRQKYCEEYTHANQDMRPEKGIRSLKAESPATPKPKKDFLEFNKKLIRGEVPNRGYGDKFLHRKEEQVYSPVSDSGRKTKVLRAPYTNEMRTKAASAGDLSSRFQKMPSAEDVWKQRSKQLSIHKQQTSAQSSPSGKGRRRGGLQKYNSDSRINMGGVKHKPRRIEPMPYRPNLTGSAPVNQAPENSSYMQEASHMNDNGQKVTVDFNLKLITPPPNQYQPLGPIEGQAAVGGIPNHARQLGPSQQQHYINSQVNQQQMLQQSQPHYRQYNHRGEPHGQQKSDYRNFTEYQNGDYNYQQQQNIQYNQPPDAVRTSHHQTIQPQYGNNYRQAFTENQANYGPPPVQNRSNYGPPPVQNREHHRPPLENNGDHRQKDSGYSSNYDQYPRDRHYGDQYNEQYAEQYEDEHYDEYHEDQGYYDQQYAEQDYRQEPNETDVAYENSAPGPGPVLPSPRQNLETSRESPNFSPYKTIPPISKQNQNNEEDGSYMMQYTIQKEKANRKPNYEKYTLHDYRKLKTEIKLGGLGPTLDEETWKEKAEKRQRQLMYAKQVAVENRRGQAQVKPQKYPKSKDEDDLMNRRKVAIEYAKSVPKPKVAPKSHQMYAGSTTPSQRQEDIDVIDLQRLQERHERDKVSVSELRTNMESVLSTVR